MSSKYFLARNKKIFGPISGEEIETLRQNGQISSYTWIFQEGDSAWTPIDLPPALPGTQDKSQDEPVKHEGGLVVPFAPRRASFDATTFRIVLFDHKNAISGSLIQASETSCEIHSDQNGSDPLFVVRGLAFLSVHDTRTGETVKLHARITAVRRKSDGSGWAYRARWDAAPSLLHHLNREGGPEVAA